MPDTFTTTTIATNTVSTVANIWPTWNYGWSTSATAATAATTVAAWYQWNQSWTTNSVTFTHQVAWERWIEHQQRTNRQIHVAPPPETAAQKAAREVSAREYRRQQDAILAATREANERAEKLLQSALTAEQREELKTKNYFHCKSRVGNTYRIHRGTHGNVRRVIGNREVENLCIQPANVPTADSMLAQKLHIEHCEDDFRRTANIRNLN